LSYGQLRDVLAARAFIRPRRLYLLDEPFDGLDEHARLRLRTGLDAAAKKGATIVMASHHADDVPPYVHRALRLRRGRAPVVEAWPPYESGTAAS
jgi:molybdate transport system ATP-binding protein